MKWISNDSCLAVDTGSGVVVPIWPQGTAPLHTGVHRGVSLPGVGDLLDGDRFTGIGVWHREDPMFLQAPGRCRRSNGFLLVDPSGVKRVTG
ncbi:hypothetical protein [Thermoactinospora rubra]|uniref:hypothetical protein n=1 Tax=Thermoactinospora rubra TaxID=1088767 RepID=UPI001180B057|nr:hypothetical protein [Thermoactinospora rubra]